MKKQDIEKWALWIFGAFVLVAILFGTFYLLSGFSLPEGPQPPRSAQSTSKYTGCYKRCLLCP